MLDILKKLAGTAVIAGLVLNVCVAEDQQFYRWVDENGVVHYGDHVPPQFTESERQVINDRGVTIKYLPAQKTAEELAAEQRAAALAEEERRRHQEAGRRDTILLDTYLSIEEIEALRDRRMELIEGQIRVTEIYLSNLRDKRGKLEKEAARFRPYSPDPEAPPIPDNLARELSDTLNSIILYEKNLEEARHQQSSLVAKFDSDIDRFKTLKGLD